MDQKQWTTESLVIHVERAAAFMSIFRIDTNLITGGFTIEAMLELETWLHEHHDLLEVMAAQDAHALEEDSTDMSRIAREWRGYRNDGLGERG